MLLSNTNKLQPHMNKAKPCCAFISINLPLAIYMLMNSSVFMQNRGDKKKKNQNNVQSRGRFLAEAACGLSSTASHYNTLLIILKARNAR